MATPVSSLYVMFNPSSGGANDQLLLVLQQLQSATPINLINMIELHQAGELTAAVVAMKTELGARLLVIGGDGTVSWALSLLYADVEPREHHQKKRLHTRCQLSPSVREEPVLVAMMSIQLISDALLGNDLSRVLGWGKVRYYLLP